MLPNNRISFLSDVFFKDSLTQLLTQSYSSLPTLTVGIRIYQIISCLFVLLHAVNRKVTIRLNFQELNLIQISYLRKRYNTLQKQGCCGGCMCVWGATILSECHGQGYSLRVRRRQPEEKATKCSFSLCFPWCGEMAVQLLSQ